MKTESKAFDCVEMKNRIQRELMDEYESRKDEFSSYAEFIVVTANESAEIQAWRAKIANAKGKAI